jgi:hypothetical protein
VSIEVERQEWAESHFSEARARRASAFFGLDRRAWERAIVKHLETISIFLEQIEGGTYFRAEK